MIIAFGRDFYKRINPSFIRQTIFADKPPIYVINNKNFTIAARFEDDFGNLINRTDAFYIEAEYITNKRNEKGDGFDTKVNILNITQCTEELFHNKENFESGSFQIWMCPIFDNILFGGSFAFDFVSTIKLNYYFCPEGQFNPYTKQKCVNNDELKQISKNLVYMNLGSQLPFVTPGDYNKGLKTKVLYNWYALDFKYHKLVYTYFFNYTMITDYGWILENEVQESYLIMNKMTLDFIELNNVYPNNKLGTFWLYSDTDNGIELFKRKYVKIQQLIAEIGGLMNFMFSFGGIIIHSYNNQKYFNKLHAFYYPNKSVKEKENQFNEQINIVSLLKNNNYKTLFKDNTEKFEMKDYAISSKDNQTDLLLINSLNKNFTSNKNINESINSFSQSSINNNVIRSDIGEIHFDLDKLKLDLKNLINEINPEINYLKNIKECVNINKSILSVFNSKTKDESYLNHIENESYDFFTFIFLQICCSCSKKISRKVSFLKNIKENFLDKMDIREYLRMNFEFDKIKKTLFDEKSNDLYMMKDEEKKYFEYIQMFRTI